MDAKNGLAKIGLTTNHKSLDWPKSAMTPSPLSPCPEAISCSPHLHRNTAYDHLWGFSCPVVGGLGSRVLVFWCLGVQVFGVFKVFLVFGCVWGVWGRKALGSGFKNNFVESKARTGDPPMRDPGTTSAWLRNHLHPTGPAGRSCSEDGTAEANAATRQSPGGAPAHKSWNPRQLRHRPAIPPYIRGPSGRLTSIRIVCERRRSLMFGLDPQKGRMTALQKPGGGVRGIVAGFFFLTEA